ncbi:MAG: cadherin repeat domain-containing protein, partial [Arcobacteraceae bacterium]|nr:cadherin repeat domain-containing protein [Arcobacteraceae bacterium]
NQTSAITLVATDEDNDTISYDINDTTTFDINSSSGVVTFKIAPDYETKIQYIFIASAFDGTVEVNQTVTINIVNDPNEEENDAPIDILLSVANLAENNSADATVGTLSTTDVDSSSFTYRLVSGSNDTDNGSFTIVGDSLSINISTDYEVKDSYSIRVRTKDNQSAFYEKAFIITITNVDEISYFTTTPVTTAILEDVSGYEYIANVKDVDSKILEGSHTIPSGFVVFGIDGNNTNDMNITIQGTPSDDQVANGLHFDLRTADGAIQSFDINVTEVNDKPTHTTVDDRNISYGAVNDVFIVSIEDGDSNPEQNITVSIDSNDTNFVVASISPANIIDSGTITITLEAKNPGDANITVTLIDDGGVENDGENNTTFSFNVKVRANGLKIYKDQKDSNYTIDNVDFDGITYIWNSTNMWYETTSTVLIPIHITNEDYKGANLNTDKLIGHYDVNKSKYIYASRILAGTAHTITTNYETADDANTTSVAIDSNFQHDPVHNLFVSRVSLSGEEKEYET